MISDIISQIKERGIDMTNFQRYHKIWNEYNPDDIIREGDGNVIHHKNGNTYDNRIENLQKMTKGEHNQLHHIGMKRAGIALQNIRKSNKLRSGENHPNYGKPLFEDIKKKLSIRFSGKNNPMYGKQTYGHLGKKHSEESKEKNRQAHLGRKHTDESKRKMSESRMGDKNHMFGKHISENQKKAISKARKEYYKYNEHPRGFLGKTHSKEALQKISARSAGANNPMAKKILFRGKIYNMIKDAIKKTGISRYRIVKEMKEI